MDPQHHCERRSEGCLFIPKPLQALGLLWFLGFLGFPGFMLQPGAANAKGRLSRTARFSRLGIAAPQEQKESQMPGDSWNIWKWRRSRFVQMGSNGFRLLSRRLNYEWRQAPPTCPCIQFLSQPFAACADSQRSNAGAAKKGPSTCSRRLKRKTEGSCSIT